MSQTACQPDVLDRFLSGQTSEAESQHVENHLSSCRLCQKHIQSAAADQDSWQIAGEVLGTTETREITRAVDGMLADSSHFLTFGLGGSAISDQAAREHLQNWLTADEREDLIGRLAQYEVTEIVGRGGMGLVLRARDSVLDRVVAIKTLPPHLVDIQKARRDFFREATLAASLRHSNVVEIYAVDTWNDIPYLVMPLLGGSLQNYCADRRLTLLQVLDVAKQIAQGLSAAHEAELVHRDIKPSNVLLQNRLNEVVISDFGLARGSDASVTESGMLAGTPQFMSPEQARGERLDARSDVFSLGSLTYWLATGVAPFEAENSYGIIRQIIERPHARVAEHRADFPVWFDRFLDLLMVKDRSQRTFTADDVASCLTQCLDHLQQPNVHSLPAALRQQRKPARVAIVAAAILIFTGLGYLSTYKPKPKNIISSAASPTTPAPPETPQPQPQHDNPQKIEVPFPSERMGPLDDLDLMNLRSDLIREQRIDYWLYRMSNLPADQIPTDFIVELQKFETSEPKLKKLVDQILSKNPFQETQLPKPTENPFVEVEPTP